MKSLTLILIFLTGITLGQTSVQKAEALYKDKKLADAQKLLTGIKEGDKDYAQAQYFLGRIAFDEKRLDDAEEFFEEAIETNDKVADYHYWMGNTYGSIAQNANVFKQGIYGPKVKTEFEKTVALDPTNINAFRGLISFYTQAPGIMGGSMEKAHECADKIKKINMAAGCQSKANVYASEKKIDLAEKEWKEAVKADPNFFSGLIQFYTNQKMFTQAFAALDDNLKKSPDNMSFVYQYGRTSAISGERLQQGEEYLKQYLTYKPKENEPSWAGANMRLGQIKEKQGNKPEAKKYFQIAVQLDSNLKEAKEGLDRVK